MPKTLLFVLLIAPLLLGGCSYLGIPSMGSMPFVHKIDVQQGNVITQEMLAQLRRGMDKKKVQYVMGTPVIRDTFHNERWDYLYTYQERGGEVEKRRVTLVFADEKLDHVLGDVKPAAGELEVDLHQDTTVDVPKKAKRGIVTRVAQAMPFVDEKEEKAEENKDTKTEGDETKTAAKDEDAAPKGRSRGEGALASTAKTSVEVPEDPEAEKAKPAPIPNAYANIQAAPGEGIIVPPDAPRAHQRRGILGRVVGAFGIGEPDYVRPSPDENKPPERLVKRPEEQEE